MAIFLKIISIKNNMLRLKPMTNKQRKVTPELSQGTQNNRSHNNLVYTNILFFVLKKGRKKKSEQN